MPDHREGDLPEDGKRNGPARLRSDPSTTIAAERILNGPAGWGVVTPLH
jgi:hypothetical protein